MAYKVLIKLFVPEIDKTYEMYIPVNKYIGEIGILLCNVVSELSKVYPKKDNVFLANRQTGLIYSKDLLVRKSDIKNGTELVLF